MCFPTSIYHALKPPCRHCGSGFQAAAVHMKKHYRERSMTVPCVVCPHPRVPDAEPSAAVRGGVEERRNARGVAPQRNPET